MNARMRRLMSDWENVKKEFAAHKNIIVEPIGIEPPEKYKITYFINGIFLLEDGKIETLGKHVVEISLHADYPRYKPICTISTPIWHPNFRDTQICIGDIWGAGESLADIIVNIGDMIQYKSWNSFSPLSADAAEWAIANKHLFPVGDVDLWKAEPSGDIQTGEFEIELLDDVIENTEKNIKVLQAGELNEIVNECTNSIAEQAATSPVAVLQGKKADNSNDFDITMDELQGIQFVPTAKRMQNVQHASTVKGTRVNFKTIFMKGILYGLIGAVIAWLISELTKIESETILDWMGNSFQKLDRDVRIGNISEDEAYGIIQNASRISATIFSGIVGGIIGAAMGLGEGLYYGSKEKAIKYSFMGLGIALSISSIGGYLAQTLYSGLLKDITEYTSTIYLALVRAIGWSVMGAGVGAAIGLIKPEKRRIIHCAVGGLTGGFLGGFIFNFLPQAGEQDSGMIPRAIGIIIMGVLIGLGIGLLEQFAKTAWLKVIRGEFEGKEYIVFAGITSLGNNGKNTIVLFKDKLVAPNHCDIILEGNKYVLVDKGSAMGTIVNGVRVNRHILRQGDAIALGNSVLVFNTK